MYENELASLLARAQGTVPRVGRPDPQHRLLALDWAIHPPVSWDHMKDLFVRSAANGEDEIRMSHVSLDLPSSSS